MDVDELIEKIERGEIKLYELDLILGDVNKAAEVRRIYLERKLGVKLEHIGGKPIDLNLTFGRNIENAIGVAQVPIGIAGPLRIHGDYAKGEFFIPLATTEGALVASVNRGCSAITRSGGARAIVLKDGMARAPVFRVPNIDKAVELVSRVREHMEELKEVFKGVSRYLELIDIQPWIVGRNVFLRFVAHTGDAMGMNMVTIATERAAEYIEKHLPRARMVSTSGNMCVDKKPNALNFLLGRGKTVIAEAVIKREIVDKVLKTSPENIIEVVYRKIFVGSAQAASYGFNAHYANIIAAMFIACGQDAAQVVESSMGITTAELTEDGDLYISVTLPSLEVGAVGGGMRLPTQRECLSILGLDDPNAPPRTRALKFAEIVASAVLAGELSLLGALAARHLGKAHEKLGRGRIAKRKDRVFRMLDALYRNAPVEVKLEEDVEFLGKKYEKGSIVRLPRRAAERLERIGIAKIMGHKDPKREAMVFLENAAVRNLEQKVRDFIYVDLVRSRDKAVETLLERLLLVRVPKILHKAAVDSINEAFGREVKADKRMSVEEEVLYNLAKDIVKLRLRRLSEAARAFEDLGL